MCPAALEYHDLPSLIRAKAKRNGDRIAARFERRTVSYRALDDESERVARGLVNAGFGSGDRIACLLFNSPEFLSLWFGSAKAGTILVPLNTGLKGEILRYEIEDSAPKGIVVDSRLWPEYAKVRDSVRVPTGWEVSDPTTDPSENAHLPPLLGVDPRSRRSFPTVSESVGPSFHSLHERDNRSAKGGVDSA